MEDQIKEILDNHGMCSVIEDVSKWSIAEKRPFFKNSTFIIDSRSQ